MERKITVKCKRLKEYREMNFEEPMNTWINKRILRYYMFNEIIYIRK